MDTRKLASHMRSHNAPARQDYPCDLCKRKFSTGGSVRAHKKNVHNAEKKCPLCDNNFSSETSLKHHIYTIHTTKATFGYNVYHYEKERNSSN